MGLLVLRHAFCLVNALKRNNSFSCLCQNMLALCKRLGLDGRVRIASEGINGTLTGSAESIAEYEVSSCAPFVRIRRKHRVP